MYSRKKTEKFTSSFKLIFENDCVSNKSEIDSLMPLNKTLNILDQMRYLTIV